MKKITFLTLLFTLLFSSIGYSQYLTEGFESGTAFPAGWVITQVNANETWKVSTVATSAHSGSNYGIVEYDAALDAQDETLTSPSFDLTSATNPRLIFWWNASYHWSVSPNDNYTFTVSIDDGTTVTQVFTETDEADFDSTADNFVWFESTIDLSSYVGKNDVKILFNYSGTDGASLGLDDVLVEETPTCPDPTALTASSITNNSVSIGWTAGGSETAWEYVVQADGTGMPVGAGTATATNPTNVGSLTANTAYEFYVRADCTGGDLSNWVGPFAFRTDCDALTAPYTQDFENAGNIPACWNMSGSEDWNFSNSFTGNHIGNDGTIGNTSSSGGYFAWVDDSGDHNTGTTLETPFVDVSGLTTPALYFHLLSHNEGNTNVDFSVDVYDGAAWNADFFTSNTNTADWEEKVVDLSGLTITGPIKVRFIVDENNGTDFYDDVAIDDVEIKEAPACPKPSSLTATNITDTTVDIGWTNGGSESAWEYVVQAAGTGVPGGAGTATASNPTNVGSLTANTAYEFYVRADCTGGAYSEWVGPFNFMTECTAVAAPYTQDFENAGNIPACWSMSGSEDWNFSNTLGTNHIGNNGTIGNTSSSGGYFAWVDDSGDHNTGTTLETPFIDVSGLTTPTLFFYMISHNEGNTNVDFSVDVYDGASWNADVFTSNTNTADWEQKTVGLSGLTITGPIKIRFIVDENNGTDFYDDIAIDDIEVKEAPTCPNPSNLMTANLTGTTVDINWSAGGSETAWEYVVQAAGTGVPGGAGTAANATTVNITGLSANTAYEFYVRADCTGGDYSDWVASSSFTTPIVPDDLNDFTAYPGDGWSEATGAFMTPSGTTSDWAQDDFGNDVGSANGKSARVNVFGGFTDEYLISPTYDLTGGTYYLNFDLALTEYNNSNAATLGADDYLSLLVTQDGTTWTELARWDSGSAISNTGQAATEIVLSGYGAGVKFAFYAFSDTTNEDNDLFIDNFQITTTTLGVVRNTIDNFLLFPRTVKDNISFSSPEKVDKITIYNIMGQEVYTQRPNLSSSSLDLSNLSSGMYIVKVQVGNNLGSYKIIKE